jgi:hypothetical protein
MEKIQGLVYVHDVPWAVKLATQALCNKLYTLIHD